VRFLIDECLTVDLAAVARRAGHDAHHVAHVGRAGWKDWNVVRYAPTPNWNFFTTCPSS
jgi:predicted nuclease of predicted toxin-antitoxin system